MKNQGIAKWQSDSQKENLNSNKINLSRQKKEKIEDFCIDTESKNVQDTRTILSLEVINKIAEEVKLTSITYNSRCLGSIWIYILFIIIT